MKGPWSAALAVVLSATSLSPAQSVLLNPSGTQTVAQPSGSSLNVNILNDVFSIEAYCNTPGIYTQDCLTNALSQIGAASATLTLSNTIQITSTVTIPVNVSLIVKNGGSFNISGLSIYLEISGPFSAGLYQVFQGTGPVYFLGGAGTETVIPQWFGAMGNGKASGFTSTAGEATITLDNDDGSGSWSVGDPITLVGAGSGGANLTTTVAATPDPLHLTLAIAPSTAVTNLSPAYNVDDSPALNRWASSLQATVNAGAQNGTTAGYQMPASLGPGTLYVPKGQYNVCTAPVMIYGGVTVTFEASNTTHAAVFNQCNAYVPAIQMNPNNYLPDGTNTNNGNGNNTLNNINIRGPYQVGLVDTPALQFLNARVDVSDTRIDNMMCESITGTCIQVGFETTGTATAGLSTLSVVNGMTLVNGMNIVVAGAGPGGANLTAEIVGGGTTNTLTLNTRVSTSVTNAIVYPARDFYGLIITKPEIDGTSGGRFLEALNNASGTIWVDNGEIFQAAYGAAYVNAAAMNLRWTNTKCYGCGQPNYTSGADTHAIYWNDNTQSNSADVVINNSAFYPYSPPDYPPDTFGGNVAVQFARSLEVKDSQLFDVDNYSNYKALVSRGNSLVNVSGNTFQMDTFTSSATNSYMLEVCCTSAEASQSMILTGNTFQNLNSSKQATYGVFFDVVPTLLQMANNNFAGNIATPSNYEPSMLNAHYVGTLTTSAASSDNFNSSFSGALANLSTVPVGSHCFAQAVNRQALKMARSLYIPPVSTKGSVVVHHASAPGGEFAVFCTTN